MLLAVELPLAPVSLSESEIIDLVGLICGLVIAGVKNCAHQRDSSDGSRCCPKCFLWRHVLILSLITVHRG